MYNGRAVRMRAPISSLTTSFCPWTVIALPLVSSAKSIRCRCPLKRTWTPSCHSLRRGRSSPTPIASSRWTVPLFEHPGSDAVDHEVAIAVLDDEGVDAVEMEQVPEQQAGRGGTDNPDLPRAATAWKSSTFRRSPPTAPEGGDLRVTCAQCSVDHQGHRPHRDVL
jgi:hypothetical protein